MDRRNRNLLATVPFFERGIFMRKITVTEAALERLLNSARAEGVAMVRNIDPHITGVALARLSTPDALKGDAK